MDVDGEPAVGFIPSTQQRLDRIATSRTSRESSLNALCPYVQANDLSSYLSLWDKDFLGWPSVSAEPVRKDHIIDWITSETSQGRTFHSNELQPTGIQISGDLAVVFYRITYKWLAKDGNGAVHTLRVTHTWVREGKSWRIVGGMSMPEPAKL
jgi:ketosteroid isomerase-like protein